MIREGGNVVYVFNRATPAGADDLVFDNALPDRDRIDFWVADDGTTRRYRGRRPLQGRPLTRVLTTGVLRVLAPAGLPIP
jgi:hypothetical protein